MPRRLADFLGVNQVTGVVVRGRYLDSARRRHDSQMIEEFVDVLHFGGKRGAIGLLVVVPMMAVIL